MCRRTAWRSHCRGHRPSMPVGRQCSPFALPCFGVGLACSGELRSNPSPYHPLPLPRPLGYAVIPTVLVQRAPCILVSIFTDATDTADTEREFSHKRCKMLLFLDIIRAFCIKSRFLYGSCWREITDEYLLFLLAVLFLDKVFFFLDFNRIFIWRREELLWRYLISFKPATFNLAKELFQLRARIIVARAECPAWRIALYTHASYMTRAGDSTRL